MMKFSKALCVSLGIFTAVLGTYPASAEMAPVTTDSRIKTFVFNENEVYKLVLHFGYQSSIEFGIGEEIETISLGDSYSWKLTPVGRRLFIKSMERDGQTNMTIVTNKRTYQFDLISKMPDDRLDEELVYVVRFYYPDARRARVAAESITPPMEPMYPPRMMAPPPAGMMAPPPSGMPVPQSPYMAPSRPSSLERTPYRAPTPVSPSVELPSTGIGTAPKTEPAKMGAYPPRIKNESTFEDVPTPLVPSPHKGYKGY